MRDTLVCTAEDGRSRFARPLHRHLPFLLLIIFLTGVAVAVPRSVSAANTPALPLQNPGPFSDKVTGDYICTSRMMQSDPSRCPPDGPLARQIRMTISDAKWLFEWTSPHTPPGSGTVLSSASRPGTWVWVHKTPPSPNVVLTQ